MEKQFGRWMCLSFREESKVSFLFYQVWLDVCCVFQPLMHQVKQCFHWVEGLWTMENLSLCENLTVLVLNRSNNFEEMTWVWRDRTIVEVSFDQYLWWCIKNFADGTVAFVETSYLKINRCFLYVTNQNRFIRLILCLIFLSKPHNCLAVHEWAGLKQKKCSRITDG